tara:strand:+ start:672 stop:866 length:195 start_codon:yes stop_codon:yes gene_type:complete
MKVGDLVKRIKNMPKYRKGNHRGNGSSTLLGIVMALSNGAVRVRVFYPEIGNDYWEDRDWLEAV